MFRRSFGALLVVGAFLVVNAAMLPYQGLATDAKGNPLKDGSATAKFSLFTSETSTSPVWSESQTVTLRKGLFSAQLGSVQPIADAVFEQDALYLDVDLGNGKTNSRLRLGAAGRAFFANKADTANFVRGFIGLDTIRTKLAHLRDTLAASRDSLGRLASTSARLESLRAADSVAVEGLRAARLRDSISLAALQATRAADAAEVVRLGNARNADSVGISGLAADLSTLDAARKRDSLAAIALGAVQVVDGSRIVRDSIAIDSLQALRTAHAATLAALKLAISTDSVRIVRDSVSLKTLIAARQTDSVSLAALRTLRGVDSGRISRDSVRIDSLEALRKLDSAGIAALKGLRSVDSGRISRDSALIAIYQARHRADSITLAAFRFARTNDSLALEALRLARVQDSIAIAAVQEAFGTDTSTALQSLTSNAGTMTPGFQAGVASYVDSVGKNITSVVLVGIPASLKARVTYNGRSNGAIDLATDSVITVEVANGGRSRSYTVRVFHRSVLELYDIVLHSTIATGTKLDHPYFPSFFVDSDIDTAGLTIRATLDGTTPKLTSANISLNWMLGFNSPTSLRVSPWRNGVQVGPVQVLDWAMDSCIYDFEGIDSSVASDRRYGTPTQFSETTDVYGWGWAAETGIQSATRAASTMGTSGFSLQEQHAVNGTNYPSAGFGMFTPWNSVAKTITQDLRGLKSISFDMKETRSAATKLQTRVNIQPGDGDTLSYKLCNKGISYGWELTYTPGVTEHVVLDLAEAILPEWYEGAEMPAPLHAILPNFAGIGISQACTSISCAVTGTFEIDNLVYHFK